jgi:hypothetical protein
MIAALTGLSILSLVVLSAGAGWMLLSSGQTSWRQGEEVGGEMIAEQMDRDNEGSIAQWTAFKGRAVEVRSESSVSLGDVKQQIRLGQWRVALPAIMAIAGLIGLLFFGSLAAFSAIDNKLVGGLIALTGIYAVVRIAIAMVRS